MTGNKIIAKIAEIVSLQDQIKGCVNEPATEFQTQWELNEKRHALIAEIIKEPAYQKSENLIVTNFKFILLSLKFADAKQGSVICDLCLQDVKELLLIHNAKQNANANQPN